MHTTEDKRLDIKDIDKVWNANLVLLDVRADSLSRIDSARGKSISTFAAALKQILSRDPRFVGVNANCYFYGVPAEMYFMGNKIFTKTALFEVSSLSNEIDTAVLSRVLFPYVAKSDIAASKERRRSVPCLSVILRDDLALS